MILLQIFHIDSEKNETLLKSLRVGEHFLGRKLGDLTDRSISKKHAIVTIKDDQVILKAIEDKPLFYTSYEDSLKVETITSDVPVTLNDGDQFSFKPNIWYKVKIIKTETDDKCVNIGSQLCITESDDDSSYKGDDSDDDFNPAFVKKTSNDSSDYDDVFYAPGEVIKDKTIVNTAEKDGKGKDSDSDNEDNDPIKDITRKEPMVNTKVKNKLKKKSKRNVRKSIFKNKSRRRLKQDEGKNLRLRTVILLKGKPPNKRKMKNEIFESDTTTDDSDSLLSPTSSDHEDHERYKKKRKRH